MRAGSGPRGLARAMGSALVVTMCAGVTPAVAADPPVDAKASSDAAAAAPEMTNLTTSVASEAAAAAQDPVPAAPSFLQSALTPSPSPIARTRRRRNLAPSG